jgi:hypothetical protein
MRPTTMRVALFVLAFVAALSVAELTSDGFRDFTQDHPLIATFVTEAVLLAGVYLVIDEIIQRRETRRWSDVTSLGIRALSTRAHEPSKIVRDAVGEFAFETGRRRPDVSPTVSSADYQKVVTDSAGELGDWLRDDDERAGSFARAMRQSASGLEEAIIRWGPTLVEDPDSAALINLLPDIVDAARSAASSIAGGWIVRSIRPDRRGRGRCTKLDRRRSAGVRGQPDRRSEERGRVRRTAVTASGLLRSIPMFPCAPTGT